MHLNTDIYMNNKTYWEKFYKKNPKMKPSDFAEFSMRYIKGDLTELGAGNGRDTAFFLFNNIEAYAVDNAFESNCVEKSDVREYMKKNKSTTCVYTRFFWHAIDRKTQLEILKWTKKYLFIEARTTDDKDREKTYGDHDRNYVDVSQLVKDLKSRGFEIMFLSEGVGFSHMGSENPHLVRVVAKKTC